MSSGFRFEDDSALFSRAKIGDVYINKITKKDFCDQKLTSVQNGIVPDNYQYGHSYFDGKHRQYTQWLDHERKRQTDTVSRRHNADEAKSLLNDDGASKSQKSHISRISKTPTMRSRLHPPPPAVT